MLDIAGMEAEYQAERQQQVQAPDSDDEELEQVRVALQDLDTKAQLEKAALDETGGLAPNLAMAAPEAAPSDKPPEVMGSIRIWRNALEGAARLRLKTASRTGVL